MKTVAFIFARGGSKGLPGKNIRLLNGKPLLQYSIDIAKQIPEINEIFVSTDCEKIAEVTIANKAKVIMRPKELATDTSPEWLSWQHAIAYVTNTFGPFDHFVSLPTTSPLRHAQDVKAALDKLKNTSADICIAVTPANRSPYFNMVNMLPDGTVDTVLKADHAVNRRQDAPEVFDITTVVYAAHTQFIQTHSSLFSGKVAAIVVPKVRAIDIDDIVDFTVAETLITRGLAHAS